MSATGLDVFDKTLHITNTWLSKIMDDLGPDRQVAWHALGATLRALRDRVLNKHIDPGECRKVVEALPQPLQALWPDSAPGRRERAA